jgi:outer membrane receptor protein involved in Fe transport
MKDCPSSLCSGSPLASFVLKTLLLLSVSAFASTQLFAQAKPAISPSTLAKYDRNGDGRLDTAEEAAWAADQPKLPASATTTAPGEEAIQLSPFEVKDATNGYYASNTLSGTRLNSKIEDLASSLSIVTKQQMADFALLDINDVFLYEAGTEGTGNYTAFDVDRFGNVNDNVQASPQTANRIRGVGAANTAMGNFETSGRVPIDPINIDAVEISRGPNSNIFGLGNASGTVNVVPSTANLTRDRSEISVRGDSYDGHRETLDVNRVLKKGVLALRASIVNQHDGFIREPSGTDTERYNAMVQYRPFKGTTVRASFSYYHLQGNRANAVTARDSVSYWKSIGSPTWDPVTFTAHLNGATVGTYPVGTTLPLYFQAGLLTRPSIFIDQNGIGLWSVNQTTNTNTPNTPNQSVRYLESAPAPVRASQPLFSTVPGISDKSIYDWTKINTDAVNSIEDRARIYMAEVDQFIINTDRHVLAAQLGWLRENTNRDNRNLLGTVSAATATGSLLIDVNERQLDGSPNPYFLRPYLGVQEPYSDRLPLRRDTYRAQLAYKLNLADAHNWTRWLGMHQVSAYAEYKNIVSRRFRTRDVIVDDHTWLPAGTPRANLAAPAVGRGYFRYYVGDVNGSNIDYAPSQFSPGSYNFTWFNGATGQWVKEPVVLGTGETVDGVGGQFGPRTVLKTDGAILQSHLWQDRIVSTFGLRQDKSFNMFAAPGLLQADGLHYDYPAINKFSGNWLFREGRTKTAGVVVKPLPWFSVFLNRSSSFQPEQPGQSILRKPLPDPAGRGEDYGFSLNLLGGKIVVRADAYTTKQINSRAGQSAVFTTRALRLDFSNFGPDAFALNTQSAAWITADAAARGVTLTTDQLNTEVAKVMGLTTTDLAEFQAIPTTETSDLIAKGKEIEINYNPNAFWTVKANIAQQESVDANLSPNLPIWLAQRLPVWQGIIDTRTGLPWFTSLYSGTSAATFLANNVTSGLALAQATEGKSRPQIREWRVNMSTNYKLAGLSDNKYLKRLNVGGAIRWESKAAIGYYGKQQPPVQVTEFDGNRPIYDKPNTYVDLLVGYNTRMFSDKIRASFQFNVRNVQESGRLQAIGAYPDGTPHTFRIIDPRQFILSATFEL